MPGKPLDPALEEARPTVPERVRARLERLSWYAARIRAMSLPEIAHRVREVRARALWRRRPIGWDAAIAAGPVGDGPVGTSALLRERLRAAAALPCVRRGARQAQAGRLRFLGRDWPAVDWAAGAGAGFWLHDPVTGRRWPGAPVSAFAIDPRATGTDPAGPRLGDAKYVWEPGRLQFLQPLAAVAGAEADAGAGAVIRAALRDFCAENPPCAGMHWTSGIELALRLVSVTLACAGLASGALEAADRVLVRRFAAAHAGYLAAFPSLHSSANNHRLAEGLGLFLAGRLVPDLGDAWEREGRAIIEDAVARLVLPDGGGAEQSLVYLAFALEMAGFAALLAGEAGAPLAAETLQRLERGAAFLRTMLDETGHAPSLGDDDETRVIAQPPDREPRYAASVVAAIAGLTGRRDLLPPDRDAHLRDALFAVPGEDGAVLEGVQGFAEAGYTVAHEIVGGRRMHLVFDHGPLGDRALSAHGHADALSVWLSVDGVPVLIDAGTWLYFSGGARRRQLRESLCHNSVSVRGASQSRASSAFGWASRARARVIAREAAPRWSVTAAHDGYRGRFGLDHRRRVARADAGIAIGDALIGGRRGAPGIPVEIEFLIPAELVLTLADGTVAIAGPGGPLCRISAPEGFSVALRRGAAEGAVRSRAFGAIEDAQRVVFAGLLGPDEAVTRLAFPARDGMAGAGLARRSLGTAASPV